jgi:hypothetical protein
MASTKTQLQKKKQNTAPRTGQRRGEYSPESRPVATPGPTQGRLLTHGSRPLRQPAERSKIGPVPRKPLPRTQFQHPPSPEGGTH